MRKMSRVIKLFLKSFDRLFYCLIHPVVIFCRFYRAKSKQAWANLQIGLPQ